ncbi:unnamed protein product [Ranitomeya imitator]|uniref:SprT-like domain-containing protein n=1 Tax=Ranitomeya imitator TaxID=111125 RepID=A0ABN9LVU7_9NEOB|nr:unnamed protein product [Ranitomeya imitator]
MATILTSSSTWQCHGCGLGSNGISYDIIVTMATHYEIIVTMETHNDIIVVMTTHYDNIFAIKHYHIIVSHYDITVAMAAYYGIIVAIATIMTSSSPWQPLWRVVAGRSCHVGLCQMEKTGKFNNSIRKNVSDLIVPPSDHGLDSSTCSDAIILNDDDDSNRAGTSTLNNLILPTSDDPESSTCSDAISNTNDDDDSNSAGTTSYTDNIPSDSEESSATEERTPLCIMPGCFLEDIISPTSIYVTNFQETKEELVERLYHLYNRTVFSNKLPAKMEISWSKRLTSASGQCCHKLDLDNDRRYSVIELSEKVCDSAVRLRSTLAHELCHAACWVCLAECKDNHGPLWQEVTRIVNRNHPELPKVTECHSYTINYKYNYKCSQCDKQIGRFRRIPDNKSYCRRETISLRLHHKQLTANILDPPILIDTKLPACIFQRCALLSSCTGCERRSAGNQSGDVTALLSGRCAHTDSTGGEQSTALEDRRL